MCDLKVPDNVLNLGVCVASLLIMLANSGCRSLASNHSFFKSPHEKQIDTLWRQGYGANNPNVEKIRNGEELQNFDGRPNNFKSAAKELGSNAVGNAISFAIFEGIPAVFRGIKEKLNRGRGS